MIKLIALFPDHLNLNGDLGNVEVIRKQFEWRDVAVEVVTVSQLVDFPKQADFIFIGHGSLAAWAEIDVEFSAMISVLRQMISSGVPLLAVSSGYEKLVRAGFFSELSTIKSVERVSKFAVTEYGSVGVLGYLNSETDLPILTVSGSAVGTKLHGPVLAKNSELLNQVLTDIAAHSGVKLPHISSKEKAGQLTDLIDRIWALETELASE